MKKISKPIVFFGSGPVAAESLRLLAQDFNVEAVITKPRAPHHRGDVPVLRLAEELNIPTITVQNRRELDLALELNPVKSDLAILIDFGIIVSQQVIDYFRLGIINSHFSVLPEWRGADPITFSLLSGQETTGVSIMLLTAGLDEGPLLGYGIQPINDPDPLNSTELTQKLIVLSHALLIHEVPRYIAGETSGVSQEITGRSLSYSRKLIKDDGILDWNKDASTLEREIRAFAEWPKSRTKFGNLDVIITKAHVAAHHGIKGDRAVSEEKKPMVYCAADALIIDALKPAGKKEMTGEAFLAGYKSLFLS